MAQIGLILYIERPLMQVYFLHQGALLLLILMEQTVRLGTFYVLEVIDLMFCRIIPNYPVLYYTNLFFAHPHHQTKFIKIYSFLPALLMPRITRRPSIAVQCLIIDSFSGILGICAIATGGKSRIHQCPIYAVKPDNAINPSNLRNICTDPCTVHASGLYCQY